MNLENILRVDADLSNRMRVAEKPGTLRTLSAFIAHSGDSWFWAAGLIILWSYGDPFWKKWALVIFGGIAVLAAMVLTIKFSVRRRRPEGEWGLLYRSTDPHSFPSGHAALILVIWAPLVALARVAMGVHYVSDILAGALLGILAGLVGLGLYEPLLAWVGSLTGMPLW